MDSEEDYGFSDEHMDEDEDVGAENMYYNSKGMLEEGETAEALDGFRNVVEMEKAANDDQRGEWGFKALKQVVKQLMREGRHTEMLEAYREMLQYLDVRLAPPPPSLPGGRPSLARRRGLGLTGATRGR